MALVSADSRIAELLGELHQLIKQTQEERSRSEHNLVNIQKTHERMQTENKISPYYRTKLRGLYTTAKADAEAECNILRKALDKIAEIKSLLEERRIGTGKFGFPLPRGLPPRRGSETRGRGHGAAGGGRGRAGPPPPPPPGPGTGLRGAPGGAAALPAAAVGDAGAGGALRGGAAGGGPVAPLPPSRAPVSGQHGGPGLDGADAEDPPEPPSTHWRNGAAFWCRRPTGTAPATTATPSPPGRCCWPTSSPAPHQAGGSLRRPPPALQLAGGRRRPLRLGQLRPGDLGRRHGRQLGGYFFLLLPPPRPTEPPPTPAVGLTPGEKWRVTKGVVHQAGPLAVVYFAEYFINQGLLELLYFPASALTHNEQYRWYQLLYQAGVFASRSSLRCLRLRRVGLLALLQVLNAVVLLVAVVIPFLPGLAVAFAMVGGEGLVGGAAYANAFLNVAEEAAPEGREFAMTVASVADTVGVALAGGAALGVHGFFCPRPDPRRRRGRRPTAAESSEENRDPRRGRDPGPTAERRYRTHGSAPRRREPPRMHKSEICPTERRDPRLCPTATWTPATHGSAPRRHGLLGPTALPTEPRDPRLCPTALPHGSLGPTALPHRAQGPTALPHGSAPRSPGPHGSAHGAWLRGGVA
ncbi:uncharacterized protein LOC142077461 [Calonectris borealis]|uniref:uncharacterized protein LOC142077461 n=1 Tax=Calonectris borealis TaxID=1323832 RepID=UPI003F4C58FD